MAEIIVNGKKKFLHYNGFLYTRHSSGANNTVYWRCRLRPDCNGKITTITENGTITVKAGGHADCHNHAPDPEKVEAQKVISGIKRAATENPAEPPARIMRYI